MRILITGARSPACLEWARLAQRAGAEAVFVGDSLAIPLARFSGAVRQYVRLPSARDDANAYGKALCEVVKAHRIEVILPTCEEAFYISHQKARLQRGGCRVIVPDFHWMARLHHKYDFQQWASQMLAKGYSNRAVDARELRVISPATHLLTCRDDAQHFEKMAEAGPTRRWILKPVWSRFATQTLDVTTSEVAGVCRSEEELCKVNEAAMKEARAKGYLIRLDGRHYMPDSAAPWVAQQYIRGIEHCSYSLLGEGRVLAHVCYQPLYRAGTGSRGSGIYFQPVVSAEIAEFVRDFGAATGASGQVAFDYKHQAGIGKCVAVLECNPRATSGIHLLAGALDDAGARRLLRGFLLGDVEEAGGEENAAIAAGTASFAPAMLGSAMLLFAAPDAIIDSFWRHSLRTFSTRWAAARDVTWTYGDPLPAVGQLLGFGEFMWKALWRRQSLLAATTEDIEWNGEDLGEITE